ncbi:MAG: SRPBCC family protein [Candidatus Brocadiales bacterium]
MSFKRRLPYLSLLAIFFLSIHFFSSPVQGASQKPPKRGQMVITTDRPKTGSWPVEVNISLFVEAPRKALWHVLTDYEGMHRFIPHMEKCRVVDRKDNRVYLEQMYKSFPLTMYLNLEVKEEPPGKISFKRYSGNMKTYEGHWLLEEAGPKNTIFTMTVKAEPGFPIPQKVIIWVLESELPKGLLEIRKRAIRISGQPLPVYKVRVVSR